MDKYAIVVLKVLFCRLIKKNAIVEFRIVLNVIFKTVNYVIVVFKDIKVRIIRCLVNVWTIIAYHVTIMMEIFVKLVIVCLFWINQIKDVNNVIRDLN